MFESNRSKFVAFSSIKTTQNDQKAVQDEQKTPAKTPMKKYLWENGQPVCSICKSVGHMVRNCPQRNPTTPKEALTPIQTPAKQLFAEPADSTAKSVKGKGSGTVGGLQMKEDWPLEEDQKPMYQLTIPVGICGMEVKGWLDSGSPKNLLRMDVVRKASKDSYTVIQKKPKADLNGMGGNRLKIMAIVETRVLIGTGSYPMRFYVVEDMDYPVMFSNETFWRHLDGSKQVLRMPNGDEVKISETESHGTVAGVLCVPKPVVIKANQTMRFEIPFGMEEGKQYVFEPALDNHGLKSTTFLIDKDCPCILIKNDTEEKQTISPCMPIGTVAAVEWVTQEEPEVIEAPFQRLKTSEEVDGKEELELPPIYTEEEAEKLELPFGVTEDQIHGTPEEKQRLIKLLKQNRDNFVDQDGILGRTNLAEHTVDTGSAKPIAQRPYRYSPAMISKMKLEIDKMLKIGAIEPSTSAWSSPVVMAQKKNGEVRFCIDFRAINRLTERDVYPMPHVDDLLAKLQKARRFSLGDAFSGFWQFVLNEADRAKTAFRTPFGLFQFVVMPFGLKNATATFQRGMENMLRDILYLYVMVYVDDLLVFSQCFEVHLDHLQTFFNRLRKANLKLKGSKCRFAMERVDYLGFNVGEGTVRPKRENVKAIEEYPVPKTPTDIRRFTGMTSFYRRFIKDYAKITGPITALTRKDAKWDWTEEHSRLFWLLKKSLMQEPILRLPDMEKPFLLYTDASGYAIGAILAQKDDKGDEYVVYYASRILNSAECRYATIEKECLAMVWAIALFRPYLYGRRFDVITDHKPLEWLEKMRETSDRLERWSIKLMSYDFKIHYRKGENHGNVDALSRMIPDKVETRIETNPIELSGVSSDVKTESAIVGGIGELRNLAEEQMKDKSLDYYFKQAKIAKSSYEIRDGLLHKKGDPPMILVPTKMRKEILEIYHDDRLTGGHLRFQKCIEKIQQRYWWPNLRKDLQKWLEACVECQTRNPNGITPVNTMMNIRVDKPWDTIGMDLVGPITTSDQGNRFVLVLTDYFTKWTEAFALAEHSAYTIASVLMKNVITRYGAPKRIITDRGKEFLSEIIKDVMFLLQIQKINTTAYHPQTDGLVERFNRTLITMLSMYTKQGQTDWDEHLPYVLFAYNSSVHSTTGYSPFYLMLAREPNFPDDTLKPFGAEYPTHGEYAEYLKKAFKLAYERVRLTMEKMQKRQKKHYEKNKRRTPEFEVADLVLCWMQIPPPGLTVKLMHRWYGPFQVLAKKSALNYLIRDPRGKIEPFVVHVNTIKKYYKPLEGRPEIAVSQYYPDEENLDFTEPNFVNDPAPDPILEELRAELQEDVGLLPIAPDPIRMQESVGKERESIVEELGNEEPTGESPEPVRSLRGRRNNQNREDQIRMEVQDRDSHGMKKKPVAKKIAETRKVVESILKKKLPKLNSAEPEKYLVQAKGEAEPEWMDLRRIHEEFVDADQVLREFEKKYSAASRDQNLN